MAPRLSEAELRGRGVRRAVAADWQRQRVLVGAVVFQGRAMRLADVAGSIVKDILA